MSDQGTPTAGPRNSSPWFPFYSDDFMGGVVAFDGRERGVYISLLCHQAGVGYVPNDPVRIARISGVSVEQWEDAKSMILPKFEERDEGNSLVNLRLEREVAERNRLRNISISNGTKGGRPKSKKAQDNPQGKLKGTRGVSQSKPAGKASTSSSTSSSTSNEVSKETSFKERKKWIPDSFQKRINSIYRRRNSTRWNAKELSAYKGIEIEESDLTAIESAHTSGWEYARKDIATLLNNWNAEVDRAREFISKIPVNNNIDGGVF